jgi:hypothetical protein
MRIEMGGTRKACREEVQRSPVRTSWAWPRSLPLSVRTYRIWIDANHPPTELRICQQPQLPREAHTVAWMSEAGCTKQAQQT